MDPEIPVSNPLQTEHHRIALSALMTYSIYFSVVPIPDIQQAKHLFRNSQTYACQ
jgi:hypothetical protein